jgi:hypothetical protein
MHAAVKAKDGGDAYFDVKIGSPFIDHQLEKI